VSRFNLPFRIEPRGGRLLQVSEFRNDRVRIGGALAQHPKPFGSGRRRNLGNVEMRHATDRNAKWFRLYGSGFKSCYCHRSPPILMMTVDHPSGAGQRVAGSAKSSNPVCVLHCASAVLTVRSPGIASSVFKISQSVCTSLRLCCGGHVVSLRSLSQRPLRYVDSRCRNCRAISRSLQPGKNRAASRISAFLSLMSSSTVRVLP
jgi:hypothetical protein